MSTKTRKKVTLEVRAESNYGKATEYMRKKQIYTKTDLVNFFSELGKSISASQASAVVMLSPRETSSTGDCRGNQSNPWGHKAYNEKLARKLNKETGKKDEQRFRFRLRSEEMTRKPRKDKAGSKQEKTVTVATAKKVKEVKATVTA